jgi:hypothetical protein
MMSTLRIQRLVLWTVTVLLLVCTAACVDTSAVKRFAAVSATAGDQFDLVADDLPASCVRQQRYLALADSQITLDDIRAETEAQCDEYSSLAQRLTGANKVLVNYLKALGKLAEDKIVVYDRRIDDFAEALDGTEMFDTEKIEAVQGLTTVLSEAVAGEWRRNELKRAIEMANPDVQILVGALGGVIEDDYLRLLEVEREAAKHYYLGQIKEHGAGEPLTVTLVFDKWREEDGAADDKRDAAELAVKILEKIARGHQKLYDNRDDLSSKQIRTMLVEYTAVIEQLVGDFEKLRDAF